MLGIRLGLACKETTSKENKAKPRFYGGPFIRISVVDLLESDPIDFRALNLIAGQAENHEPMRSLPQVRELTNGCAAFMRLAPAGRMAAAFSAEESPGSTETRCRIASGGGDPRESATESKPPSGKGERVR